MSERDLSKQIAAARVLKVALEGFDDLDLLRDSIEGETTLHEAIARVMASLLDDEVMLAGLDEMLKVMGARKSRIEKRVERQRAAIEQGMIAGELKTLPLPDATLSIREIAPKIIVTDETKLPAEFFTPQPPKLNKSALNAAVNNGLTFEGVTFSNKSTSLSIRRA